MARGSNRRTVGVLGCQLCKGGGHARARDHRWAPKSENLCRKRRSPGLCKAMGRKVQVSGPLPGEGYPQRRRHHAPWRSLKYYMYLVEKLNALRESERCFCFACLSLQSSLGFATIGCRTSKSGCKNTRHGGILRNSFRLALCSSQHCHSVQRRHGLQIIDEGAVGLHLA